MNREDECVKFGNMLYELEKCRSRDWEEIKRLIQIPLCIGLSGIGKTTFARRAIEKIDSSRCENPEFINSLKDPLQTLNIRLGKVMFGNLYLFYLTIHS